MKISDEKLQEIIGFHPFKEQEEILNCEARNITIVAGRRFGKSALCAYIALKELFRPNRKIWIVAPSYDLTQKVFTYLIQWYMKVNPDGADGITNRPFPKIHTVWGSVLECRSTENPTGLLGDEVDLMICDEAAQMPPMIYERFLKPVLAIRQGRRINISTPFGKNWFFEQAMKDKEKGGFFNFPSKVNPALKQEEWDELQKTTPEKVFRQEYLAEFTDDAGTVFRGVHDIIKENCLADVNFKHSYVLGVDLGRLEDFTVLTVVDTFSHEVVFWDRFNKIDWPLQKERIKATGKRYNNARILIDATAIGAPITEDLQREYPGIVDEIRLYSNSEKKMLVEKLSIFIEQQGIFIPNEPVLIDELLTFTYKMTEAGNVTYAAPAGYHDDAVISLAAAVRGLDDPAPNNPNKVKKEQKVKIKYQFI